MWVVTFSSTTMASSTTMPMDIDKADSDTMFRVLPVAYRYMNDAMSEMGIVMVMMSVARQRPRKKNTTITTKSKAYITVSTSDAMVLRILSEVSTITPSFTSEGRRFWSVGSISSTLSEISTELAPLCFCITIIAPCSPLLYVSCVRSSSESSIRATSRRYTLRPSCEPTTILAISSEEPNSPCTRSEYVSEPMSNAPPGMLRFSAPMSDAICSMVMPYASRRCGSVYTWISRLGAPDIDTEPTPLIRARGLATASSRILYRPGMLSDARTDSMIIGIMSVENLKIIGVSESSGSIDDTMSSLSRTSLVRTSISSPYSNSRVITDMFSRDFDVMCLRLLTELSTFSSGRVTFCSMSCALAPVYVVITMMVLVSISG